MGFFVDTVAVEAAFDVPVGAVVDEEVVGGVVVHMLSCAKVKGITLAEFPLKVDVVIP